MITNQQVCDYVKQHKIEGKYYADKFVEDEYGQNLGGYLGPVKLPYSERIKHKQKEHFLNYYQGKNPKRLTYCYLRCPQLLLFVAEVFGVSRERVDKAAQKIMDYENNKMSPEERADKDGNYLWRKQELRCLKDDLMIYEISWALRNKETMQDVIAYVKKEEMEKGPLQ